MIKKLEEKITGSFKEVFVKSKEKSCDLRTAANIVAIDRILLAERQRSYLL